MAIVSGGTLVEVDGCGRQGWLMTVVVGEGGGDGGERR